MKLHLSAIALGLACAAAWTPAANAQAANIHHVGSTQLRQVNISQAMQSPQLRRSGVSRAPMASPTLQTGPLKIGPSVEIGPTRAFYDIDGPDGELWFCSTELGVKPIEHEYWTEYILQEYWFTIYDSNFNKVGTIHDKMRYADDEVSVPGPDQGISLLPVVTKNFFNTDDKYEIVVSLAVNVSPGVNNYRSVIYSLGAPTETVTIWRDGAEVTEEVDKAVAQYDGFIVDVLDVSTNGQENFYMTFADEFGPGYDLDFDKIIEGDEEEGQRYWEMLSQSGNVYEMYGKATADGKPAKMFTFECTYQQMQGDQESTPPMLTFARDGQGYIVCPYYKDTFFNPYYSPWDENMSMRLDNSLVVDLYKIANAGAEKVNSIEVPVEKIDKDGVIATYYSVGDLNYSADVIVSQQGNPLYVVTRCNYLISTDGTTDYCYYIYDSTGAKTVTVFENADSNKPLTSVPGREEQVMFVSYDDFDGYIFNFVDLLTGYNSKTVAIPALLDTGFDDPETLSANMDRVPMGGGTYQYAFEMKTPLTDEYDNTFMRVAWFNANGSFDRIDHINMGQNVMYAQCWIDGAILTPDLIVDDNKHEYLILVKRGISDTDTSSQEELIVGQPANEDLEGGKTYLNLGPCEKGELRYVSLYYPTATTPARIFVSYANGQNRFFVEFYDLPLPDNSGIEGVMTDSTISFDGQTVTAQGIINVYSLQGSLVASGYGNVCAACLPAGVYVAVAGNSSCKILVNENR